MQSNQGSQDWHLDRLGHVTASRFQDILPGKKGPYLQERDKYMLQLATERIYQRPTESASSQSMQWGKDAEPYARAAYEIVTGSIVLESDFIKHPTIAYCGCSPDGLIDQDGGYESKCPANSAVHIATWRDGMPEVHKAQVQGCMLVTGRKYWDFVSFDPRATPNFRLYIERIERDKDYIAMLEKEITKFLAEVEIQVSNLLKKAA